MGIKKVPKKQKKRKQILIADVENRQKKRMVTKHFSKRVVVLRRAMGSVVVTTVYLRLKTLPSPQQRILGCPAVLNHGNKRKMQMPWKRAGPLKACMRLAEIAPLIDVVVGHSYLSNTFHHLVELWCAHIPLELPRAAAENMSFYFYLLIFEGPRHPSSSLRQIGTDRPLLSAGCTPSTFFSCAPLKSLQCSWLCWQGGGSEWWTARRWRSSCSIRRAIHKGLWRRFSGWLLAFKPLFTFNFGLRREWSCPRPPLHLASNEAQVNAFSPVQMYKPRGRKQLKSISDFSAILPLELCCVSNSHTGGGLVDNHAHLIVWEGLNPPVKLLTIVVLLISVKKKKKSLANIKGTLHPCAEWWY